MHPPGSQGIHDAFFTEQDQAYARDGQTRVSRWLFHKNMKDRSSSKICAIIDEQVFANFKKVGLHVLIPNE